MYTNPLHYCQIMFFNFFQIIFFNFFISQEDCQLEVQLFKLYHNEQGINHLTNELKTKSRDLDKLEKKKNEIEQELKNKKQDNAKLSREMASVEKKIASKVQNSVQSPFHFYK